MKNIQYIHIPKTGGNSFKKILKTNNDVGHHHANFLKKIDKNYNNLYVIAIVRNTWERVHSIWNHRKYGTTLTKPDMKITNLSFKEYLKKVYIENNYSNKGPSLLHGEQLWDQSQLNWILDEEENLIVDEVCDFNHINDFAKKLQLQFPEQVKNISLPKKNTNNNKINFKESYDDECIDLVYKMYKEEIKYFKYEYNK